MKDENVKTGDVFLAHNKYMYPPKEKFHLCINKSMYFLINTRPSAFNCVITPEDCSFLKYESYINCGTIRFEPIKDFKIIKKEQLSERAISALIKKVICVPTLLDSQKNIIISDLQKVLENNK